jgi:hypothetical protein
MKLFMQTGPGNGASDEEGADELLPTEPHRHEDHTFEGSEFLDDALRMTEQPLDDTEPDQ